MTIFFICVEIALVVSWLPLIVSLSPSFFRSCFQSFRAGAAFFTVLQVIGMLIIEPLYVLGGFGLYLNRRTLLEGWDLDLVFRETRKKTAGKKMMLVAALMGLFVAVPRLAAAEATSPKAIELSPEEESWREDSRRVLSHPDFGEKKEVRTWVVRSDAKDKSATRPFFDGTFLFALISTYGGRVLLALIILALAAIAVLLVFSMVVRSKGKDGPPVSSNGDIVEAQSVFQAADPLESWAERSLALWTAGKPHEAVALLFLKALSVLEEAARGRDLTLDARSLTEAEGLRAIPRIMAEEDSAREVLRTVFRARIAESYGLKPVAEDVFLSAREELIAREAGRGGREAL